MEKPLDNISVIGFDADDTLWINETYYRDAEKEFANLLSAYETHNQIDQELFKMEMRNLRVYGYGVKGFVLSMVEMALELSNMQVSNKVIERIIAMGKEMLDKPVELLEGVHEVLEKTSQSYRLILVTKGDLLDQERKLEKSELFNYFHHIEILSDKQASDYTALLKRLEIKPEEFLMIGNSLKSDILPLVEIGAHAIHIPFHTTWLHEQISEAKCKNYQYLTANNLNEVLQHLK